ncbi:MAG TPA: hypothetical protein VHO25_18830 [Polyangiaceae bacterium]|nr:hypothetical protein [Polyangiaceae bacterium]
MSERAEIEVFGIGSSVLLDGTVSARVTGIMIREGRILYECVWWNERDRQEEMVEPWEIRPDGEKARRLMINQIL